MKKRGRPPVHREELSIYVSFEFAANIRALALQRGLPVGVIIEELLPAKKILDARPEKE